MTPMKPDYSKLAFIGIGAMGSRIAGRLLKSGFPVTVFNRNAAKANALIAYGATVALSIPELASETDVILSCLANDEAVRNVYIGPQGVLAHIRPGSMIIEMSTVSPETSRELHRLSSASGVRVLDVPVSGSTQAAEQGIADIDVGPPGKQRLAARSRGALGLDDGGPGWHWSVRAH